MSSVNAFDLLIYDNWNMKTRQEFEECKFIQVLRIPGGNNIYIENLEYILNPDWLEKRFHLRHY